MPRSSVGTPRGVVLVAASGLARGRAGLGAIGFAAGDKLLDGALLPGSGDLDRLVLVYLKACKELKLILNLNSKSSDHIEKIILFRLLPRKAMRAPCASPQQSIYF